MKAAAVILLVICVCTVVELGLNFIRQTEIFWIFIKPVRSAEAAADWPRRPLYTGLPGIWCGRCLCTGDRDHDPLYGSDYRAVFL